MREMEMVAARKPGSGSDKVAPLALYLKQHEAVAAKAAVSESKSVSFEGDETPGESKKDKKKRKGVAKETAYQDAIESDGAMFITFASFSVLLLGSS